MLNALKNANPVIVILCLVIIYLLIRKTKLYYKYRSVRKKVITCLIVVLMTFSIGMFTGRKLAGQNKAFDTAYSKINTAIKKSIGKVVPFVGLYNSLTYSKDGNNSTSSKKSENSKKYTKKYSSYNSKKYNNNYKNGSSAGKSSQKKVYYYYYTKGSKSSQNGSYRSKSSNSYKYKKNSKNGSQSKYTLSKGDVEKLVSKLNEDKESEENETDKNDISLENDDFYGTKPDQINYEAIR